MSLLKSWSTLSLLPTIKVLPGVVTFSQGSRQPQSTSAFHSSSFITVSEEAVTFTAFSTADTVRCSLWFGWDFQLITVQLMSASTMVFGNVHLFVSHFFPPWSECPLVIIISDFIVRFYLILTLSTHHIRCRPQDSWQPYVKIFPQTGKQTSFYKTDCFCS